VRPGGPVPPPLQGAAATTETLTAQLAAISDLRFFNNAIGTRGPAPWRAGVKLARTMRAALGTLVHARGRGRALYLVLDGGYGLVYNLIIAALARLCRYRLYLHHHSFAYINTQSPLMALLTAIAGPKATHVVLCAVMGRALSGHYSGIKRVMLMTNAGLMDMPTPLPPAGKAGSLTIGFLSNLIIEKGVDTAIDITRRARARGLDVRLVLGGGAPDAKAAALVCAPRPNWARP
jgi:glycosyltransferase involved in cell wall biosynthesis